jgi:Zn-dependent protease
MFRLLGFDVRVRLGFVFMLGIIAFIYPGGFGIWLAGALAIFTLIHELGHAVAARAEGAQAAISLNFMVGYTSFVPDPRRPLTRVGRAKISAAGPLIQIAISAGVLAAMGVNPISENSVRQSEASLAIWWAGPVMGALNLIPVLPLDGGHLAQTALENFIGKKALRAMAIGSLAVTGAGTVFLFSTGRTNFVFFLAFLLLNQYQIFQATSPNQSTQNPLQRHADAETAAWQTGTPGILEPGQRLSPWYEAHRALAVGDRTGAAGAILTDLQSEKPSKWSVPSAASKHQLHAVVDTLPEDLPAGNMYSERVLADVLLATGEHHRAGEYAAGAFSRRRSSPLATIVARSAAKLNDAPTALQWLGAAADTARNEGAPYPQLLATVMDHSPEFVTIRGADEYSVIRASLR